LIAVSRPFLKQKLFNSFSILTRGIYFSFSKFIILRRVGHTNKIRYDTFISAQQINKRKVNGSRKYNQHTNMKVCLSYLESISKI
jgi:hypothetical protein